MLRTGTGRHRYPPLLTAALLAVSCMFTVPAHADPTAIIDPDYTAKILDGEAQFKAIGFTRPLPNPLTPAYIYSEICQANPSDPRCQEGELEPNEEGGEQEANTQWYDMTMRETIHGNAGLVDDTAAPLTYLPGFRVRTYGPTSNPALNAYPARTIVAKQGTPVKIVWRNELQAPFFLPVDKTIMCGPEGRIEPANCPENAAVVHVHGGHGFDHSDGLPEQWFTPPLVFNGLPAQTGTLWKPNNQFGAERTASPIGTFVYPMDSEASTVWYHDHATGITRLNAMSGLAGFLLIRDNNELAMQQFNATATPPVPPKLPSYPYEVPIAVQDHVFWGETVPGTKAVLGQMAVPNQPLACTPLPGLPCPAVIPNTPSVVPEFFGNIPLTNGVAWPKLNVEPRKYRLRLLNACDSRTLILQLATAGATINDPPTPIPGAVITIIGNEQGFLNAPLNWTQPLVIMPGMRFDVIVDFAQYNGQNIVLQNIGGDAPFMGQFPDPVDQTSAFTVGQIMKFIVDQPLNPSVPNALLPENLRTLSTSGSYPPVPVVPAGTAVHRSFLKEALDQYNRVKLTMDYKGLFDGVSELAPLGATQVWEIANLTPDSHPMHLHLVKFRIVNRETINQADYDAIMAAPLVRTPPAPLAPTYRLTGVRTLARPYEAGFIDTVECPPGQVTRIVATFDVPGLYVWHCHILQHEEFDMMREFAVTIPARGVKLTSNAAGTTLPTGTTVTFTAEAQTGFTGTGAGDIHLPGSDVDMPSTTLAYEYQFSVKAPSAASWGPPTAWDRKQTYTLPLTAVGTWRVKVDARQLGGNLRQATNEAILTAVGNTPAGILLSGPSQASQLAGSPVAATFTATGLSAANVPGTGPYDFQFSLKGPSGATFTTTQAYSAQKTWTWIPNATQTQQPGIYTIRAEIRTAGTNSIALFTKTVTYTILGPKPVGVTLSPNPTRLASKTATAIFTATGLSAFPNVAGPGPYEYRFWLKTPTVTWAVKQNWSSTATWSWSPGANGASGTHQVQVEVRQAGSTVGSNQSTPTVVGAKAILNYNVP